jgi:pimeloyl-[acyl-carrier protein] synthase
MSETGSGADWRQPADAHVDRSLAFEFNPTNPAYHADPIPYYRALLAGPPVQVRIGTLTTVFSRYADCVAVLRDHQRFSSVIPLMPGTEPFQFFGDTQLLTFTDPPAHTRLRRLVAPSFAPRKIEEMAPRVRRMADRLLDRAEAIGTGEIEMVSEVSNRLPIMFIGEMLGVPEEDFDLIFDLTRYLFELARIEPDAPFSDAILKTFAAQRAYFTAMIEKRRQQPGHDLISEVIAAHDDKGAISDEEMMRLILTLVLAGITSTADQLTTAVFQLLQHPAQLAELRRAPALIESAVEEIMRVDPAVNLTIRVAAADVDFGGVRIPRGTPVYVVIGAANRDSAQFADPDRFDIKRHPNDHLSFGEGIHFCLGAAPARLQTRIAVIAMLERWPRLHLNPNFALTYRGTPMSRGIPELRLLID